MFLLILILLLVFAIYLFNKSSFMTTCGYSGNIPMRNILSEERQQELLNKYVQVRENVS